jgi:hypothetical protein
MRGGALLLVLAAPALAQGPSPDPVDQQLRTELKIFEAVLQAAVRNGGDAFARQQAQFLAGLQLTAADPQAHGFAPPNAGGILFFVSVPAIRPLYEALVQWPQSASRLPVQQTSGGTRAGDRLSGSVATSIPRPDPMSESPILRTEPAPEPAADDGRCATRVRPPAEYPNPNFDYAVAVCDALVDALLDSSGPLRIKDQEWLWIAAANGEPDNVLNSNTGYTTYLSIKGEDLLAYRQGRISKEEARRRVDLQQR